MPLSEEIKRGIKEVDGVLTGQIGKDTVQALIYLLVKKGVVTSAEVQEAIKQVRDYTFEKTK